MNLRPLALNIPVQPLLDEITSHPDLWNLYDVLTHVGADPRPVDHVILQYNNQDSFPVDPLETIAYPPMHMLPAVKFTVHTLMYSLNRDRLGRALVAKVRANSEFTSFVDDQKYTDYYERVLIPLNPQGAAFQCGGETIKAEAGQVVVANNQQCLKVINPSSEPLLTIVVDLRRPVMKRFYGEGEFPFDPTPSVTNVTTSRVDGNVTYQVEKGTSLFGELKQGLLDAHYEELALNKEALPLDPNWAVFAEYEKRGVLYVHTMRRNAELVGYYVGTLGGHLHYASTKHCQTDLYFIRQDLRKAGLGREFFDTVEADLRARGVKRIVTNTKVHRNHSKLFEAMGYRLTDYLFTKIL